MLRLDEPAFRFMRRRRGRHEVDQVEVHRLAIFLGRAQMAEMNRIEASAENAYSHDVPMLSDRLHSSRVLRDHEKSNNPALALNILLEAHLAVAANHVFVGSQLAQSHRAARMQAIGRDAGFGAEAEFEAVGEARRRVYVDRG